ncbi:hypothetical protein [Flagellimonas meridianipacifica]|uniref:Uncharacterized protein n=1 Tax=Flagellimonas meridianipacifica TaxID=1080225 RepID=A0A2T0M7Z4_9FLAO|nr:hypothetical protein [Allomuricauda pacifica]PRX53610.1 hypothetical protein CLV81_1994 [Allomuricauda pacifica]
MKSLVLSFAIFTVFQIGYSQGDSFKKSFEDVTLTNSSYLYEVKDQNTPKIVQGLQLKAANYDVRELADGQSYDSEGIKVIHRATNGYISTVYNKMGQVVTSWERFRDVAPPKSIQKLVAKNFKGWEIVGNKYISMYDKEKVKTKVYKLKLSKEGRTKRVTIDLLEL